MLTGEVKFLLYKNQDKEATDILATIITRLTNANRNTEMTDMLILTYIDRINLMYKKERYEDAVADVHCIKSLGYDIYSNKEILLIYHECRTAIHNNETIADLAKFKLYDEDIESIKENLITNNAKKTFEK